MTRFCIKHFGIFSRWWVLAMGVTAIVIISQPACGRSDVEASCVSYRYRIAPTLGVDLNATLDPGGLNEVTFTFAPPSLIVDFETHQAIQDPSHASHDIASTRARILLADAARELCRRTLEAEPSITFDYLFDPSNCDLEGDYTAEQVIIGHTTVTTDDFDDPGPPITLNPACHGVCLLNSCGHDETGGSEPDLEHPFTFSVRCSCLLESLDYCDSLSDHIYPVALSSTFEEYYCIPNLKPLPDGTDTEGADSTGTGGADGTDTGGDGTASGDGGPPSLPGVNEFSISDFCRFDVADYLNASIRTASYYDGAHVAPLGSDCGLSGPDFLDVRVTCMPTPHQSISIENNAALAYAEQTDTCSDGCGSVSCNELNANEAGWIGADAPCKPEYGVSCDPDCTLNQDCDCDLLPFNCYESQNVHSVCLPDEASPTRLKSAISLLAGLWQETGPNLQCSQIQGGTSLVFNGGPPPPTSTVSGYTLTNGTSYMSGLQVTCPAPTTDDLALSTFDTSLEELCREIPLCEHAGALSLTITASEGTNILASGTLTKSSSSISTTEQGEPLSTGDHAIDLCVEENVSGTLACIEQSLRATSPLGSGVGGYGYFAGELAPDFVTLRDLPGAVQLSLSDDDYQKIELPSGFDFPFYGTTVSESLYVGANGGINVTNEGVDATNSSILPPNSTVVPDIAVYWDDLDPSSSGGVYTWFDGKRFIVSWEDVPHGRDGGTPTNGGVNVQAHIYEDGRIELHYQDTDFDDASYNHGKTATMGIVDETGTYAVEVGYDDSTLLSSGVGAVGFALSSDGCLADELIIPPEVACTALDHFQTVCTPSGETVDLPLPVVTGCSPEAVGVVGKVIESGTSESTLVPLSAPIAIDSSGGVELDEGVHRVRWWPIDAEEAHVGPGFTQLVFATTWAHSECSSQSQSTMIFTSEDDTYIVSPTTEPLALFGLHGEDILASSAGDDLIADGGNGGICEANDGNDAMVGEDGDDTLDAGSGDDRVWGGDGDDLLLGGAGNDLMDGQEGDDILEGGDNDDELWGGLGDDVMEGGPGEDVLYPGSGVDAVYGGLGNDTIIVLAACELTSGKLLSGGDGTDTLVLASGLDLAALASAGTIVDADIESVVAYDDLPVHKAKCEAN